MMTSKRRLLVAAEALHSLNQQDTTFHNTMSDGDEDNSFSGTFAQGLCGWLLWRAQHPNGDLPDEGSSSGSERVLAAWHKQVIEAKNQLRLTDEEETVLREIDFQFPKEEVGGSFSSSFKETFNETFNENLLVMKQWKVDQEVTHLMIPRDTIVNGVHIGKYIANMRDMKKKKDAGKNVLLTNQQISVLDKEGMVWGGVNDVKWHMQFELMKSFIKENSDQHPRQGNKLGDWACNQRRKYAKGTLAQEYIDKLNSIQFKWN